MVWAGKTPNQGTKVQKSRHRAPHPGGERGEGALKIPNTKLGPKCKTGEANQSAGGHLVWGQKRPNGAQNAKEKMRPHLG